MDLRTQTALIVAVLCLAMAGQVLLRPRRRRVHWLFGFLGLSVGFWYLSTVLGRVVGGPVWERVNHFWAAIVPLAGAQFFRAFATDDPKPSGLAVRAGFAAGAAMIAVTFTPVYNSAPVRIALFIYVLVLLVSSLAVLYSRSRSVRSRFEAARLRYLALVGALATVFTLADYLPYVGLELPPVGSVLILILMYVLSQSVLRYRILDLYELAGRLGVLTALAFTLAATFWLLVELAGGRFFLHSVVAALVVLLLFDPVRSKVEEKISQIFFRERYDIEQAILDLRRRVARILDVDDLTRVVLAGLEQSRRVTHASVYLVDLEHQGYDLMGHVGPAPVARVELAPARPLIDRIRRDDVLVAESLERELAERREMGEEREAETLYEILQTLQAMSASVCAGLRGEKDELFGFLCVRDDRLRDAYSPEETQLLRGLSAQMAIAVENSRLYRRMKDRDRLAALGEMAAGIAHEIRNPLGAIKASAQYLIEEDGHGREFLDIIVDEVDRLNRVVSSFLDYARPSKGDPTPSNVNSAVQRTMQLLGPECTAQGIDWSLKLDDEVPAVRIDVEQLRQVLINLIQNAVQAMEQGGKLTIETAAPARSAVLGQSRQWVEIRVADSGPGIPQRVLANLFVPFVTTKDHGTGLGLAISQRIVSAVGGLIEVRSQPDVGTTFIVRLPLPEDGATASRSAPPGLPTTPPHSEPTP